MRIRVVLAAAVLTAAGAACLPAAPNPGGPGGGGDSRVCAAWSDPSASGPGQSAAHASPQARRRHADRCLRLNEIQAIGSHNSYHVQPGEPLFSALRGFSAELADSLEYTHPPLGVQFADEGVRQIELDVFADPAGGRYSFRHILPALGLPGESGIPELDEPGFKVFHVQEIDFETRCLTLVACLRDVRAWSQAHAGHLPVAVLLELKEEVIPDPLDLGFVQPIPFDAALLDALDAEIRSVFGDGEMITPDDVRGGHATLEEAVLAGNWPRLADARGKVLFLMDNGGHLRDLYRAGRPSLEGRAVFTNASPGEPDAAFVKRNDPLGPNNAEIQDLVAAGYVVRTRADADTVQARTGDTGMRDAAFASGAQWVSTDYPVPGSSPWTDYFAAVPGGDPARCNPVNTGPACDDRALEDVG